MKYYRHTWLIENGKSIPLSCITIERVLDDTIYEIIKEKGIREETYRVEEITKEEYLKHTGANS